MSTYIFYKKPEIVDRQIHRQTRLKLQANGFNFASVTNSVPITSFEFSQACQEYPIVFAMDELGGGVPLALLGLRDAENLFIGKEGQWDGYYIPAFVRRYPFILQNGAAKGEFTLLIDTEAEGFNAPDGEMLFNEDGSNSAMLNTAMEMMNQFNSAADVTAGFVRKLRELDLLTPRTINVTTAQGQSFGMTGFSAVDEAKLATLSDADLLSLTRSGYLFGIYAHLISLSNIQKLMLRVDRLVAV